MIPPYKPNNTELLTKEQAIAFTEKGEWKSWTPLEIVEFQLYQRYLAIPFKIFLKAMETVFERTFYPQEFDWDYSNKYLIPEFLKTIPKPTDAQIRQQIRLMKDNDKANYF